MKEFLLFSLLLLATIAQAQQFSYSVQLNSTDSIDTQKWLNAKPTENKENELAQKYANLISPILRQYVSTTELPEQDLQNIMQWNIQDQYKDVYKHACFGWNAYKYSNVFHSKVSTKAFRDFLFSKACDVLCELIAYYPKDYKTKLIQAFTDAQKMLNDAPNHKYEIKDSNPNDSWEDLVIFKDGVMNRDLGYGINGFLLRRIYLDNIPLSEIKEKTTTLLTKLKATDNSKNPAYLTRYTINNEIAYCITAESNYFISIATGKRIIPYQNEYEKALYPNIIKYRYNAGQNFYVIQCPRWSSASYKSMVIDKNANIIYQE